MYEPGKQVGKYISHQ